MSIFKGETGDLIGAALLDQVLRAINDITVIKEPVPWGAGQRIKSMTARNAPRLCDEMGLSAYVYGYAVAMADLCAMVDSREFAEFVPKGFTNSETTKDKTRPKRAVNNRKDSHNDRQSAEKSR